MFLKRLQQPKCLWLELSRVGKMFGRPLDPNSLTIPPVITKTIEYFEKTGYYLIYFFIFCFFFFIILNKIKKGNYKEEGLFRISGSLSAVELLKSKFEQGINNQTIDFQ